MPFWTAFSSHGFDGRPVLGRWLDIATMVASGAVAGSRQACDSVQLEPAKYTLPFPETFLLNGTSEDAAKHFYDADQPVVQWTQADLVSMGWP